MLGIVARDKNNFDRAYHRLIDKVGLDPVSLSITMEPIVYNRDLSV
ncbi:MAG: hypothetical protein NTX73_03600 [Rhodobacterales bacterium]|nr:hypothetical protein [Rhodobacterales bacterium]